MYTIKEWNKIREEYKKILQEEEYGEMPPKAKSVNAILLDQNESCAGKGIQKDFLLTVTFETGEVVSFPFSTVFPVNAKKNKAVVLLNFGPEIPHKYYPTEEVLDKGWGVARIFYKDVVSDTPTFDSMNNERVLRKLCPHTGRLMMWAWSAMRVLDFLCTMKEVDEKHVGVAGHSRLGKTALVAGAFDERFAFVHSNCSGTGGACLYSEIGENSEYIKDVLYSWHWFCDKFASYEGKEKEMPLDQYMLGRLIAPRTLSVTSAKEDLWATPKGEFAFCHQSSMAWEVYGKTGLVAPETAQLNTAYYEGNVGYFYREGTHYFSRMDWTQMLHFFDKQIKKENI